MGVCPSWKPPTSFTPLRSLAAGVATSSITAVDPYPWMCAVLAFVLATALILSSVRNYFKHVEDKKKKKNARGGKETRDRSAAIPLRKERTANESLTSQHATLKPKPMEQLTKSSAAHETTGLGQEAPKKPDTTVQPSTGPAAKIPPPPPPKPVICPAIPVLSVSPIPQITSSFPDVPSERQVTSYISEEKSEVQETKELTWALDTSTEAQKLTENIVDVTAVPKMPEVEIPPLPKVLEEKLHQFPKLLEEEVPRLTEVEVDSAFSKADTKSFEQDLTATSKGTEVFPILFPSKPQSSAFQEVKPTISASLESELAAFKSSWAPEVTKQSEKRQEVSMETTSVGQQYHSLTSETKSWSSGPLHEASSFVQAEETRKISKGDDDVPGHVKSFQERKVEDIRVVHTEFSSTSTLPEQQKVKPPQLSPPAIDALSWRPSSPIFSQPIQPPGGAFGPISKSPTPPPTFDVYKPTTKEAPVASVWSPPTRPEFVPSPQPKQGVKKVPLSSIPRPYRKGRLTQSRPTSAPPMGHGNLDPYSDTELVYWNSSPRVGEYPNLSKRTSASSRAISDSEDWYNPYTSDDEEMGSTSLYSRRKKMYSSSSFYEEPYSIYPTVEEQVELARKIAGSLSNDNNRKSRGASMFFKRVKRANSWVHEGPDPYSDGGASDTDMEPTTPDPGTGPYVKVSSGPPKLKLILDPRQLQDFSTLRSSGLNPVEHAAISPDICLDLVRDMNSPRGKGAALFAKRKQKAEDWVVDEEKVKQQIAQKEAEIAQLREESTFPFTPPSAGALLVQNRLKLIKSPWEAALESPYGTCDSAFVELPPVVSSVATSIIRAAENKLRNSTTTQPYSGSSSLPQSDICKPKAPRGWEGPTTGSVPSAWRNPSPPPVSRELPTAPEVVLRPSSGVRRPYSFHDFNSLARSWNSSPKSPISFRHVDSPKTNFLSKSSPRH